MSRAPRSPLWGISIALCAAVVFVGCQDGYPIAPTLCDRWCEVKKDQQCGYYHPAECVVACEQAQGYAACEGAFAMWVTCLEALPRSALSCNQYGIYNPNDVTPCANEETAVTTCAVELAGQGIIGPRE